MRRFVTTALAICIVHFVFAQDTTVKRSVSPNIGGYDHLLIQFGGTNWQGKPDSIQTGGFSRSFNAYFMFAFPFKTNPHISVALGPGIATDHIFFKDTYINIADPVSTVRFSNVGDTTHFKKYKLATAWLEAPVELRYTANPDDDKHSVKVALGVKVGTLLAAWTKGKNLESKSGAVVKSYIAKEKSKRFFNTNRLLVTGRVGYGKFSLFGSYCVTPVFKEGVGPTVRPLTIGLTLSGL